MFTFKEKIIDTFIEQLRKGNNDAFRQLVTDYQQRVRSTALSMVQDMEVAEDLTQEVFVTVYRSIGAFNGKSALSTWIYRITVNKCLDYLRSRESRKKNGLWPTGSGETTNEAGDFIHPGITAERRELSILLYKTIKLLPENQHTAFVLVHIEELPQKEVAEIMNLSVKAIESLLQRAKSNLRKWLSEIER